MVRSLILLISFAAILLALSIIIAGPGTRFGLWDYTTGFAIIRMVAIPVLIAALLSIIAFGISLFTVRSVAPIALIAAVLAGAAGYAPLKMKQLVDANPLIHDITTDIADPPPIIEGANYDRENPVEYVGGDPAPRFDGTIAQAQRTAFPEIAPILLDGAIADNVDIIRSVIAQMNMAILKETPAENEILIEATSTSAWFGFVDDFVVRLRSDEGGTRIDVRSKSRVGVSDLGANAARIREFSERLKKAAA